MSFARKISIVAGSMLITVLLVLGLARLPAAYPFKAILYVSAEQWLGDSFETQLARELELMRYPEHRPMLYSLALLQVAEQARKERLEAISRADRTGGNLNWGQRDSLLRGASSYRFNLAGLTGQDEMIQRNSQQETTKDLLLTILCFVFVIIWLLARKP